MLRLPLCILQYNNMRYMICTYHINIYFRLNLIYTYIINYTIELTYICKFYILDLSRSEKDVEFDFFFSTHPSHWSGVYYTKKWFSKCGPWSPWQQHHLRHWEKCKILSLTLDLLNQRWGLFPSLCFKKPSRGLGCTFTFEEHRRRYEVCIALCLTLSWRIFNFSSDLLGYLFQ